TNIVLAAVGGQYLGYMFMFQDNGHVIFHGNRYVYEATACLVLLTAIALARLPAAAAGRYPAFAPRIRAAFALTLAIFIAVAFPYNHVSDYRTYSNNYWEGSWPYYDALMSSVEKPALVLMTDYNDFRQVYFTNPPKDTNPVIFAQDISRKKLLDSYPDRHVYVAKGWQLTKIR